MRSPGARFTNRFRWSRLSRAVGSPMCAGHGTEGTRIGVGHVPHREVTRIIESIHTHESAIWWIAGASIVTFIATLIVVPWLIVRIPPDYFAHGRRQRKQWANRHSIVRGVLLTGKNLLGYILIAAGIAMLVLPGQGMLTILLGIILVDLPGKYRLERWFVARRPVLRSINWLRRRAGRAPLVLDE